MNKKYLSFLLPIRSVVFILVFVISARLVGKEITDISNWWTVVATIINILNIAMLIIMAKKCDMTYGELINYEKGRTKIKEVVIIIIVTFVLGMTGMYLVGYICYGVIPYMAPVMIEPIPKVLAIINVLLLPVTTALAEDGLYLGAGVNNIKSKWAGVLVPAFFYALQHCFIPTLFDMRYIIYRFLSFLPLTVVYCWYYRKKKNPVPIMIGHAAIDVLTVAWVLATSMVPGLYEKLLQM